MATSYERCNELENKNNNEGGNTRTTMPKRRTIPQSARRRSKAIRPNHTEFEKKLFVVVNSNALIQFIADIVLEALHLLPSRVNLLSLTFLNAFIAFKTLSAVQKGKFQFLHEDCQFLFWMEICLILGDIYYMIKDKFDPHFIYVRLFFLICSVFNWGAVTYVMWKYNLWHITYQGHKEMPRASLSARVLKSMTFMFHSRDDHIDDPEYQPNGRNIHGSSLRSNFSSSVDSKDHNASDADGKVDSDGGDEMIRHEDITPSPRKPRRSFFAPSTDVDFGDDFGAQSDSDIGSNSDEYEYNNNEIVEYTESTDNNNNNDNNNNHNNDATEHKHHVRFASDNDTTYQTQDSTNDDA